MFYEVTDYETSGQNALRFTRYYNSRDSFFTSLGLNWISNFDRTLRLNGGGAVVLKRLTGPLMILKNSGSAWVADTDTDLRVSQSGANWTVTDHDDTVEVYSGSALKLSSITTRNGYAQTLTYNSSGQLASVTDSYNRTLTFIYDSSGALRSLGTPDGTTISYGYTLTPSGQNLTSVTFPTAPLSTVSYAYENSMLPNTLTGVIDENGNRYLSWTYDTYARALSSKIGSDATANLTTVTYNDATGSRTVTNALGVADTYSFTTLQSVPKVIGVSRAATATTAAASRTFTYDSNGYMASSTDWNGNKTTFINDPYGDSTTINEAVGSSVARTTTIAYDSTWVRLPASVVTPGLTSAFTYDASGEELTKILTDTTKTTAPYATGGQTRTWAKTWNNLLLASLGTPNGNTTHYGYDGTGALISVTDALNHITTVTQHQGGGLPQIIVDPNNVTTTLTYDARQRLTSSTVSGSGGTFATSWAYDPASNLIKTTLPDNSYLANSYDSEHRLTKVTDALGSYVSFTLDALGDRTQTSIYSGSGTATWQRSDSFDALGRMILDTAGAGQVVTQTFDPQGNLATTTDGLKHTITNSYDALNRRSASTDANNGTTTPSYDSHNRVISVTDANSNTTSYLRNGFGDVIQQTSPDSGVTVFHYDADANLSSKTDALSIVTDQTFDTLDRPLTTTYPAHPTENVAYTYDQTGAGFAFGIGRLTSVTDAAGMLTRAYEERGDLASENRISGASTLFTGYTYDGANRIASMTYPDGLLITYQHDAAGYVTGVTSRLPGSATTTPIGSLTHLPFGPMNGMTYGNGIAETWAYDQDYRAGSIVDTLAGATGQNLAYLYDNANNVKSITDAVNAANSQTFGYDVINRLTSATSSPGGYGTLGWTYDKVRNRLTQTQGATVTVYGYTPRTNRLLTITTSTTKVMLRRPSFGASHSNILVASSAKVTPGNHAASQILPPMDHKQRPNTLLATVCGWPMLLLGLAGIVVYRKRLLRSPPLAIITFALLTGGATILIGCALPLVLTATPAFQLFPGNATTLPTLTISDATSGATIFYTTNGTAPTTSSTKYTGPFTVSSGATIEAIAAVSGFSNSAVAVYALSLQAAPPAFTPAAGSYAVPPSVTLSDITPGATIYYTTNGTAPSANSIPYTSPIAISGAETIEAIVVANGYLNSPVASASYTLSVPTVATPTFSPGTGTYTAAQTVTISDATAGASIFYTTDGTNPSHSSTPYAKPIAVSSSEVIKAIANAPGATDSVIATATYTISIPAAPTPTFSPGTGTYSAPQSVTISDTLSGASIYYTIDGTTPTVNSTPYTTPIAVSSAETIEAIATASGYTTSPPASATYTINTPNPITVVTNANGNITSIPPANSSAYATFAYNNANRLASVIGSPMAATFVYDWAGQRYSKTDGGLPPTVYSYAQGGTLIAENNGGTVTDYVYADGRPIAAIQPTAAINQVSYINADRLGAPQIVTNNSGATVWQTTYQPFGTTGIVSAAITQNLRLPGQYADIETGFSYNLNRDYMPNLGRYSETDPMGAAAAVNTYIYAEANPLKFIDIDGKISRHVIVCIFRLLCSEPEDPFDPHSPLEWSPQEDVECPSIKRPSYFKYE